MRTEAEYRQIISDIESKIGKVRLVAVSKTRSVEEILACYHAGARLFGENHVQEIVQKFSGERPSDMKVYMIGHLQSNKVNKVVPLVDMIQSVDSYALLEKINRAAFSCSKTLDVLLEVNCSGEESKSGFSSSSEVFDCLEKAKSLKNVVIKGFMGMGPVSCAPEDKDKLTHEAFAKTRELSVECQKRFPEYAFTELSMGMSGDYMIGVEEGATMVRIGTAIFGERIYA
ncbi:MAG: YggS family pyridoxal phosphate-dependent enzyme [Sphaerochaetaceae bacterium]|nr:YggS family pyridoxal phosphate-dependent enzyme [Sphaerochaetaceae bacterium]